MTARKRVRKKPQTIRAIAAVEAKAAARPEGAVEEQKPCLEPEQAAPQPVDQDPNDAEFQRIAKRFAPPPPSELAERSAVTVTPEPKRRRAKHSLVALKEHARCPELVQLWDADARDPEFLVELKTAPGVVQVPATWQGKSDFFRSRYYRRPPYRLPQAIQDTGIMDLRDVHQDEQANLTQKSRERVQPKLGKLDLDYRKIHAAFFKFQAPPRLSGFGAVFDPSKPQATEIDYEQFTPGVISDRLRSALGLAANDPLPWASKLGDVKRPEPREHWGVMILDESESEDSAEEESEDEEIEPVAEPEEPEPEPEEPELEEPEVGYAPSSPEAPGQLYTVLDESTSEGFLGPSKKYDLG